MDLPLLWVSRTPNTKTGDIPSCYVGETKAQVRESCQGCPLLEKTCYAWAGFARMSIDRLEKRRQVHPENYTLDHALKNRHKDARAVRIGSMGDPARGRSAVLAAIDRVRALGLAVLSYTHFWRDQGSKGLEPHLMASCEDIEEAGQARAAGWVPAVLLPWDHYDEVGPLFAMPDGTKGVVCPAQTKDAVTCNSCLMCSPQHPVWKAGKVTAIGFLDHSRKARGEAIRWGSQLPLFRDVRATPPEARS